MSGFWLARGKTKSSFFDANVSAEHKDKQNPHFLDVRLRADTTGSISTDDHSAVQDAPLRLVAKREDMVWKLPGTSELTSAIIKDESELPSVALMSLILRRFSSSSSKHSPSHHRPAAAMLSMRSFRVGGSNILSMSGLSTSWTDFYVLRNRHCLMLCAPQSALL